MIKFLSTLSMLILGITAVPVQAHQIWLEQDAKTARLYFGEFGQNLREVSPGLLDKFVQPTAILLTTNGEQQLKLNKIADAFMLSARAGAGQSIIAEDAQYPSFEKKNGDTLTRIVWTPGARYITDLHPQPPKLALDIVPTGKAGEFKVYYKGKALPNTKVGVSAQFGWGKDVHTDQQGIINISLPWQGAYLLEVHHTDKTPGERNGVPYDVASFATTLSLVQNGIAPIETPLPADPQKGN